MHESVTGVSMAIGALRCPGMAIGGQGNCGRGSTFPPSLVTWAMGCL